MEVIELESIESTNSYAKMNLEHLADCSVVHAFRQTSGRGRLNRSWIDLGEGNLFMSIVLKPSATFSEVYPNLTQYLSVCVCKVLENFYNLTPSIKWPNDVLINGKKIVGILSETVMQGEVLKGLILGIGVNLNATKTIVASVPNKLVTSLNLEVGKDIDMKVFRTQLLEEFFKSYNIFLQKGFEFIKNDYINRNCFLKKELNIQQFNNVVSGFATSITDRGELILTKEDKKEVVLTIGDIL